MKSLYSLIVILALSFVGCSSTQVCRYQEKVYDDGLSVYLKETGEICLCEENRWICIPVGGASQ